MAGGRRPVFGLPEEVGAADLAARGADVFVAGFQKAAVTRGQFPAAGRGILALHVDERVRQAGYFGPEEPLLHRWKVLGRRGPQLVLSVLSCSEAELHRIWDEFPEGAAEGIRRQVPAVAAVAALAGRLIREPVLVADFGASHLTLVAAEGGIPAYAQVVPYSEPQRPEPEAVAPAVAFAVQAVQRQTGLRVAGVLPVGPLRGACPPRPAPGVEIVEPDWAAVVGPAAAAAAPEAPALYGAPFVDPALDLLPAARRWARAWLDALPPLAAGLGAGALALAVAAAVLFVQARHLEDVYMARYRQLQQERRAFEAGLPAPDRKADLERLLAIRARKAGEPDLDQVLVRLAEAVPNGVKVVRLQVRREGAGSGRAAPEVKDPARLLDRPLILEAEMVTQGGFSTVGARFDRLERGLDPAFDLKKIGWMYDEESAEGYLSCRLIPRRAH